jgi:hypothetical protein
LFSLHAGRADLVAAVGCEFFSTKIHKWRSYLLLLRLLMFLDFCVYHAWHNFHNVLT